MRNAMREIQVDEVELMPDDPERGSIPEWVMLLVMGIGVVLALWAIVQPSLGDIVTNALGRLR
ncbi:hypothetical protein IMCC26256_11479 [Actinobacteria bacterium IMCC26256]|jgi:hypothetical protein|uniref:Unannotated protein n=1 Tax=freshwater metagenome TaxID=449393 RepID=A0A6J7KH57_9ZZZZ|nr:hypothetical protein IMCC26256_11479 [Actinobacteria bacterium IMCC26256]MBJ7283420.1 hypothetical protein [Acidimicrobiia bacterium]MSW28044.1 hypothetical protein [Actinomycetota bacterium]